VCEKTEASINKHVETLHRLGMIVNSKKTEAVYFSKTSTRLKFKCQNEEIMTRPGMKVLGVYFDEKLSWTPQIKTTINKISRLTSGLKFLRKRLSKRSFLKATTSQFYGLLYYGSQVWLGSHTKVADIRRLNSVHYKLLRIVENDWKKRKRREDLDKIGRAKPSLWAKYSTANLVLKVMKTQLPQTLHASLVNNSYATRRNPDKLLFYDASRTILGHQALGNRLAHIIDNLDFNFHVNMTDDQIRINLKKSLNMCFFQNAPRYQEGNVDGCLLVLSLVPAYMVVVVFPLGEASHQY